MEIVSFGSKYYASSKDKKGIVNTDASIKELKKEIERMTANMGGTNIYNPLDYAINGLLKQEQP